MVTSWLPNLKHIPRGVCAKAIGMSQPRSDVGPWFDVIGQDAALAGGGEGRVLSADVCVCGGGGV